MSDLISRQDVYHILEKAMIDRPLDSDRWVIRDIDKAIRSLPSADRPTGEWIEVDSFESEKHSVTDMRCSLCRKYASIVLPHRTRCVYDYCPNCGAKMKGGDDE